MTIRSGMIQVKMWLKTLIKINNFKDNYSLADQSIVTISTGLTKTPLSTIIRRNVRQ